MNPDELKAERTRRDWTQQRMADFLGVPLSTYIKWETGKQRKKPLPRLLAEKLSGRDELDLSILSLNEISELNEVAKKREMSLLDLMRSYMREGLERDKGVIPLIAFGFFCWLTFAPGSGANEAGVGAALKGIAAAIVELFEKAL